MIKIQGEDYKGKKRRRRLASGLVDEIGYREEYSSVGTWFSHQAYFNSKLHRLE